MPDFPASPLPSYPIEESPAEPEVLISTHRDGSEQRRYKGPGSKRIFRLSFGSSAPISQTEADALLTHWADVFGTTDSFNWAHPERGDTIVCRYKERPTLRLVAYNSWEGEVLLQEVPV